MFSNSAQVGTKIVQLLKEELLRTLALKKVGNSATGGAKIVPEGDSNSALFQKRELFPTLFFFWKTAPYVLNMILIESHFAFDPIR